MKNTKNILRIKKTNLLVCIFFIVIILLFIITGFSKGFSINGRLYISEIMSKNTYTDLGNNTYSDYIEIYNGYDKDINLLGYHLSDNSSNINKWTFPDITISKGEYLVIYADGINDCNSKDDCHTNFKLSKKGETVIFTNSEGTNINKFTYPSLTNDIAYGYVKNNYLILDSPSPGKENDKEFNYNEIKENSLYINEYMIYNQRSSYDVTGNYNDFIELYNNSSNDIDIHNIFLTDDKTNLIKYKLPDTKLEKDNYLLIYLGDESMYIDNQITGSFKLSKDDKYIILSNGVEIIDSIKLSKLIDNVSYGKVNNEWYYFTKPTPGYMNNTKTFNTLDEIYGNK